MDSYEHLLFPGETDAVVVFCNAVAINFVVSAWAKIRNLEAFRLICAGYPGAVIIGVRAAASFILVGEVTIGAAMIIPYRLSISVGVGAAISWITVASGAIALRRMRGERRFRCGCGTDLAEETSADGLLVRNALLIAVLAAALARSGTKAVTASEAIPHLLTALGLVLGIYLLRAAARTWRQVREWETVG